MKYTRFVSCALMVCSVFVFSACLGRPDGANTNAQPTEAEQDAANANIERQEGLIATFPTADLPILDRVSVISSLRNESGETLVHEAEYISNTPVSDLYAQYKSSLERAGWTEQNPDSQEVGSIKIMTANFVRGNDTISIAIQTSTGTNKELGATTILLKIEQAQ